MAPETQLYVTMVPPEKVVYAETGERGPAAYAAYNGNRSWPSFRGLTVYTTNPFDSGDSVDAVQMLRRQTQVGEFYVMRPPSVWNESKLPGTYMDMLIYDEQKDQLAHVGFREAMMHAMPWMLFRGGNPNASPPTGGGTGANAMAAIRDGSTPAALAAAAVAIYNNPNDATGVAAIDLVRTDDPLAIRASMLDGKADAVKTSYRQKYDTETPGADPAPSYVSVNGARRSAQPSARVSLHGMRPNSIAVKGFVKFRQNGRV